MSNAANNFDVLTINLNVLHHYFDSLIKFSINSIKLYPVKFLDTLLPVFLYTKDFKLYIKKIYHLVSIKLHIDILYIFLEKIKCSRKYLTHSLVK